MGSTEESTKLGKQSGEEQKQEDDGVSNELLKKPTEEQQQQMSASDSSCESGTDCGGGASASSAGAAGGCRPRYDSNSSSDSARSPSTDRLKRRRTTSLSSSPLSSFFFPPSMSSSSHPSSSSPSVSGGLATCSSPLPGGAGAVGVGAAPPVLPLDEVVKRAVDGVTNMALAHEIALDSNFQLEKFEPPPASLEKQVRDVMFQAFWDNLRQQLSQDPPVYTQAFVLLQEVRDQLLDLTFPHQRRLRQEISDKLDVQLIKQQAQHGVLDFSGYSGYVVELMLKMCAPLRDEAIQQLKQQQDVVTVFAGVLETLDLMKLDMANFTIRMHRPTIMKQIVEYERGKFKEFLKTQSDGLDLTRKWILKHVDSVLREHQTSASTSTTAVVTPPTTSVVAPPTAAATPPTTAVAPPISSLAPPTVGLLADPLALRAFCNNVLNSAYMELLQWPQDVLLPETVCMDTERILELRDRLHQVCLLSATLLVALSTLEQQRPCQLAPSDQQDVKERLKRDLCPILDPAYTQSETLAALPNLIEQVIASLNQYLGSRSKPPLSAATVASLKHQLQELNKDEHRVTALVTARCVAFIRGILGASGPRSVSVPAPFVILQEELARICGSLLRLTQHNRAVFGEYYFDMTENRLKEINNTSTTDTAPYLLQEQQEKQLREQQKQTDPSCCSSSCTPSSPTAADSKPCNNDNSSDNSNTATTSSRDGSNTATAISRDGSSYPQSTVDNTGTTTTTTAVSTAAAEECKKQEHESEEQEKEQRTQDPPALSWDSLDLD